jgi:hypothetical protein
MANRETLLKEPELRPRPKAVVSEKPVWTVATPSQAKKSSGKSTCSGEKDRRNGAAPAADVIAARQKLANEFYAQQGYKEHQIPGHLNGIDFAKPIDVLKLPKVTVLEQAGALVDHKYMSSKVGSFIPGDDMVSEASALSAVDAALQVVRVRLSDFPKHGVYLHALEQLEIMEDILQETRDPREFVSSVDIGLMVAKELDPSDPELADALMLADFQFKKLAGIG